MARFLNIAGDGFDGLQLLLDRFSENIANPAPMFDAMADVFADTQRRSFDSSGATYGGWAPLSPAYAAWKDAHYPGQPILTLTGELRASLAERPLGVEHIDNQRMVLGTAIEYARYHQDGTSTMPARPIINEPTSGEMRQYGSILHEFAFKGVVT